MDREVVAGLIVASVLVAAGLLYAYDRGSFREVGRQDIGHKNAVWFAGAAILLCLLAVPFAVTQGAYARRFRREEERLRAERPEAIVSPYEGPEGSGVLFDDAQGRVLLLRGPGGLGAPRIFALPPAPAPEPAPEAQQDFAPSSPPQ